MAQFVALRNRNRDDPLLARVPQRERALTERQKKQVKAYVRGVQELKYFISTQVDGDSISNTFGVNDISAVPQGDTDLTRDGDRLQWCGKMNIFFNFVAATGASGDLYDTCRLIVFQWKPMSTPVAGDILLNGPSGTVDVYSQHNHDRRQEYIILYDKLFTANGNNSVTIANSIPNSPYSISKRISISLKKARKMAQFTGASTTGTNKFYYLFGSDSSAVTHPTYSWSSKYFLEILNICLKFGRLL